MSGLHNFTDEQLKNELKRREEVAKEARKQDGLVRYQALRTIMRAAPNEALLLFAPTHSGTVCNDSNPHRDYFEGNHPECLRCWLLSERHLTEPIEVTFYIRSTEDE